MHLNLERADEMVDAIYARFDGFSGDAEEDCNLYSVLGALALNILTLLPGQSPDGGRTCVMWKS